MRPVVFFFLSVLFVCVGLVAPSTAQPRNDGYLDPITFTGGSFFGSEPKTETFSLTGSTLEPDEPNHAGVANTGSVWFETFGSRFPHYQVYEVTSSAFIPAIAAYKVGTSGLVREGPKPFKEIELFESNTRYKGDEKRAKIILIAGGNRFFSDLIHIAVANADARRGNFQLSTRTIRYPDGDWKLSDTNLEFNGSVGQPLANATRTFTYTNEETYLLNLRLSSDKPWLKISQSNTNVASEGERSITITVDPTGLPAGVHEARLSAEGFPVSASTPTNGRGTFTFKLTLTSDTPETQLFTAVLPGVRSVGLTELATTFVSVINGGTVAAKTCSLSSPESRDDEVWSIQETRPSDNSIISGAPYPFDLAPGQSKSFVLTYLARREGRRLDDIRFDCLNTSESSVQTGLNTFILNKSTPPYPDLLISAASVGNTGIVDFPRNFETLFAAATVKLNDAADDVVIEMTSSAPGTVSPPLPLRMQVCPSNPATAECTAPFADSYTFNAAKNEVRTFTFRIESQNEVIPFDPAKNRIHVVLKSRDTIVGANSLAVRTR